MKHVRDTWLIFQYEVALLVRNPATVAITLIQPITYLLLFSPFLKSVMHVSTYSNAFQIYVPSLFAAIGVFNGMFAGFTLLAAVRQGVVTRHRVTPVSRVSLLLGRLLMHILLIVFQAVVVTVAAIALGLRVQPANFLISLAACGPSSRAIPAPASSGRQASSWAWWPWWPWCCRHDFSATRSHDGILELY